MALSALKIVTLTEAASRRAMEIIASADKPVVGLRIGVKNGGCAGMSYVVELAHEIRPGEDVVEDRGVKLVIDPKAMLFILGTELDFQQSKLASTFVFNNPNQTSACGCGESIAITPAKIPEGIESHP